MIPEWEWGVDPAFVHLVQQDQEENEGRLAEGAESEPQEYPDKRDKQAFQYVKFKYLVTTL